MGSQHFLLLLFISVPSVWSQTIDQIILLAQESSAVEALALQSPNTAMVTVELDMVFKKDVWEEMQRQRLPLEEYNDTSTDTDTDTDTHTESDDDSDSDESTEDCGHETQETHETHETHETGESHGRHGHGHHHRHHNRHGHRGSHGHHRQGHGHNSRWDYYRSRQHGSSSRSGRQHGSSHERSYESHQRHKRKAIRAGIYRWPNNEIPYVISSEFNTADRQQIGSALRDWENYTCLSFRERTASDTDFVSIVNGGGCSSMVGKAGGEQPLTLGRGCRVKSVIIHELGHAIGFQHEQTRPDRDTRVRINNGNIYPGLEYNFRKYTSYAVNNYDVPYDYLSVMHYGQYAFSVNGQRTITTNDKNYQHRIGNAQGLSFRDIKAANLMYSCSSGCDTRSCPGEGFLGKDCKCWCKGNPIKECDGSEDQRDTTDDDDPVTEVLEPCTDSHPRCSVWAARGECPNNPVFMLHYCKSSCNSCDRVEEIECSDKNEHCDYWAKNNYCGNTVYGAYMEINCPKSCKKCGVSEQVVTTPAPECVDRNGYCNWKASRGHCRTYRSYMLTNCRKACNFC